MFPGRIRYFQEELKFMKSARDARFLAEKVLYILPRLLGLRKAGRPAPASLQLEPTNYCNSDCICCSAPHSARKKGNMSSRLFQSIIDQAAASSVKRIHLYLHGEPLLHPEITAMVRYIKSRKLAVHLTTNGMLLEGRKMRDILESGLTCSDHLVFSVLGHSPEVHRGIMRGIEHERVVANISEFMAMRSRLGMNGPVVETIFYEMPENTGERTSFVRYWRGRVDHVRVGAISESYRAGGPGPFERRQPCSIVKERMAIFWNGDVTWCCADVDGRHVVGNLKTLPLTELWQSPELLRVRTLHSQKRFQEIPFCLKCDM